MTKKKNKKRGGRPMNRSNPLGTKVTTSTWGMRADPTPGMSHVQRFDNQIYRVTQMVDRGSILTSSAGAAVFYGSAFTLADLPQYASWQTVFDQYKIEQLELWIMPTYQDYAGGAASSMYASVIDYDDSVTPSTMNQLLQYTNVIEVSPYQGTYRRFKPHVGVLLGVQGITTQGLQNEPAPWIDIANSAVNHNGLKIGTPATTVTITIGVRVRYTIAFRNVF